MTDEKTYVKHVTTGEVFEVVFTGTETIGCIGEWQGPLTPVEE